MVQFCCWENCDFSATVISDLLVEVSQSFFEAHVKKRHGRHMVGLVCTVKETRVPYVSVLCVDRLEQSRPLK